MLNVFKSFNPQTIIILMVFAIILKFGYYIHPPLLFLGKDEWAFNWLLNILQQDVGVGNYWLVTLGIINIVLQALFVNRIATEHKLLSTESFVPAALFLMISTLIPSWNILSAPQVANWFVLFTINNLLRLPFTATPSKLIYNCGLFIGIGTLFYYPIILLFILPIWGMFIINPFKIKDLIIYLLGLITVFYFWACAAFLLDWDYSIYKIRPFTIIDFYYFQNQPTKAWSIVGILTILLTLGIIILNAHRIKQIESIKKMWSIITLVFVFTQILSVINANNQPNVWFLALAPATLFSANLWISDTKKWIKITIFWLLMGVIIYNQYF